ncbi:hypothetical protein K7X08_037676 [Anisodus acutangulus]|uniref:Pentatricopeptide repeat-containing protein n=1 Tax=Anisodus acutangulus TaxID=402998 RepID=A0A9Q1RSG1_9SOLA|nr:hypothetical protein K7X08_037676 [Anisodus acutangulus]
MSLLDKILEHKLSPSNVTFNLLVHGQCKVGEMDNAFRLLRLMEENGLAPDEWTYGTLVDGLCERGRVEEANIVFRGNRLPRSFLEALLAIGLGREGHLEEASRLVDHMQSCGMSSCEDIYNSMVNCFLQVENV